MQLIIVESPTKARTLSRFLGKEYVIEASMGHVRDLPKSQLGVDTQQGFAPTYIVPKDKSKHVNILADLARKADRIILATDPDREGEAIAWHISEILKDKARKKPSGKRKKAEKRAADSDVSQSHNLSRITFHEITESAIKEALSHPGTIDLRLVDAQQARRVLDRLVGYTLSPLLWKKLSKRWLSAGRVQSVAVRLIVEREREIQRFAAGEYWTVEGMFSGHPELISGSKDTGMSDVRQGREAGMTESLHAQLVSKDGVKYEQTLTYDLFDGRYTTTSSTIHTEEQARQVIGDFRRPFTVSSVVTKEIHRSPPSPYTTSTLQQDAGRRLYFSAKKTMQIAQKLYEEGYITYHRTDSVNLSDKFTTEAGSYIQKTFGDRYALPSPRRFKAKSKVVQEAHEAIRPTDVYRSDLGTHTTVLNKDHSRLYELIWKRAVASQAAEAVFDSTTLDITSSNGYVFETNGSVIRFDGFLKITGRDIEDVILPPVAEGQQLHLADTIPTRHMTSPPPRYTEASLVKTLEEKGIGRPSTYAPIISTIVDRQYVTKDEKKLVPTELGFAVTDFLVRYFPDILDLPFTARLEDNLDAIANGNIPWPPVIAEFYEPFSRDILQAESHAEKVKLTEEKIDETCPESGHDLVIRTGKFGKFIACTNFPECKYTRQYGEKVEMKCPRDGADIVVKRSRRGKKFYGCSNYPKCTFAAWRKEDIK